MLHHVKDRDERLGHEQVLHERTQRREALMSRARQILNRAILGDKVARDKDNVAFVIHPSTAQFLLLHAPELFKVGPDAPCGHFFLEGVVVYFSEELAVDEIVLAHSWWPITDRSLPSDNPDIDPDRTLRRYSD